MLAARMPGSQRDNVLLLAFFVSGVSALGYELLWTRMLSLALGNETLGVLGVLAGFFGGLALGAAALHRRAIEAKDPVRMFAVLEVAAAAYALVSPWILYGLARVLPAALGPVAGDNDSPTALVIAIIVAGASLLPGTFCMGATLPALVEARRRVVRDETDARGVGRLYAANTAGATLGVLGTVHVLMPAVGIAWSGALLGALGVSAAALAMRWGRPHGESLRTRVPDDEAPTLDASRDPDPDVADEPWLLLVVLFATGLFGVGLEVVGVQVLGQILENTVYTFADILAVYLVGTAIGAAAYTRFVKPATSGRPATVIAGMLIAVAVTTVLSSLALAASPAVLERIAPHEGSSHRLHQAAELAVAGLVFGLPTLVMGATFSHVTGLVARRGVGRAYAVNTLGSALAPILFTLWIIPSNGYRDALFVIVYGYLLTFGVFTWFRRFKAKWQVGLILGVVVTTTVAPRDLVLVDADEGWTVISRAETTMGLVIVSEKKDDPKLRRLQVGRHFRMGGAFAFGERRMGHIPLLLHPQSSSALYLGVGTGSTLGAVTTHPELQRVDAVELVPAVVDALPHFADINGKVHEDPRVTIHRADARRFVAASSDTWDVVVADLFHPGLDGAGGLYALEHFEGVRDHLAPKGMFAQWVPLYQLDRPTLQTIVRTFLAAFPDAHAILGVYNVQTPAIALLGGTGDAPFVVDPEQLASTLAQPIYAELLMQEPRDLLGAYLLDREALAAFAGDGPLNTDLRPEVLFAAPRVAYEGESGRGWENLLALWEHAAPIAADVLASDARDEWHADATRFQTALHEYLLGERARVDEGPNAVTPETAVDHYLAAYDAAPDFAPARGMLYAAASSSPDIARRVYPRMLQRTPNEPRVYQAYLPFLKRTGDEARLREVEALAKHHLAGQP